MGAIEFRIHAFAAMLNIQAIAAFAAISLFVLAANGDGFAFWMICALHFLVSLSGE